MSLSSILLSPGYRSVKSVNFYKLSTALHLEGVFSHAPGYIWSLNVPVPLLQVQTC